MPMSKSGKYFANPQQMRASDKAAPPMSTPDADADDAAQSITISKTGAGFHTSEPNGDENDYASFDEAMQKAKECLGVADDSGGDAEMPGADAGMGY